MTHAIIIPCLHDHAALRECLERLAELPTGEILIADGSPEQNCRSLAESYGVRHLACPEVGRGPQLRYAAQQTAADLLIFLHADTPLERLHLENLVTTFTSDPHSLCGVFYRDLAWQYPRLSWLVPYSRHWQREISILYGDQTQFFRRTHYERLGGYPPIPLMEDVAMSDLMRAYGGLVFLDPPTRTSLRRFTRLGWLRTKLWNLFYILAYRLGVSPGWIYQSYYGKKGK